MLLYTREYVFIPNLSFVPPDLQDMWMIGWYLCIEWRHSWDEKRLWVSLRKANLKIFQLELLFESHGYIFHLPLLAWASVVCQLEPVKGDWRLAIPPGWDIIYKMVLLRSSYSTFEAIFVLVTVSYKDAKTVKVKVKALLNVKVKVFYFGYKQQQMDKSVLVLTQTMFPTTIPRQFYFDNKQL